MRLEVQTTRIRSRLVPLHGSDLVITFHHSVYDGAVRVIKICFLKAHELNVFWVDNLHCGLAICFGKRLAAARIVRFNSPGSSTLRHNFGALVDIETVVRSVSRINVEGMRIDIIGCIGAEAYLDSVRNNLPGIFVFISLVNAEADLRLGVYTNKPAFGHVFQITTPAFIRTGSWITVRRSTGTRWSFYQLAKTGVGNGTFGESRTRQGRHVCAVTKLNIQIRRGKLQRTGNVIAYVKRVGYSRFESRNFSRGKIGYLGMCTSIFNSNFVKCKASGIFCIRGMRITEQGNDHCDQNKK